MADLVFSDFRLIGSPTPLVFGGADFAVPSITVEVAVTLGGVTVAASLVHPVKVNAALTLGGVSVAAFVVTPVRIEAAFALGGVTVSAAVFYDNRVTPYMDARSAVPHQAAVPGTTQLDGIWLTSLPKRDGTAIDWTKADAYTQSTTPAFAAAVPERLQTSSRWDVADKQQQRSQSVHQTAIPKREPRSAGWQQGVDRRIDSLSAMQAGVFKTLEKLAPWQTAQHSQLWFDALVGASQHHTGVQAVTMRWQLAGWPHPGRSPLIPVLPVTPTFDWGSDLVFACPPLAFPNLVFGAQCDTVIVPGATFSILPARFYMTAHSIYAQRLPDLAEIPIYDATVAADEGSYCWTLSASGPASLFALLAPVDGLPVQLRVTMDGIPWVFAVDSISRSGSFGKTGVSISGRSVTALIGAPYLRATARNNALDRTAQQLAEDALESSGVALDWGLTDWLVPAGAWSHQGTPLDAVQAIAQAAGGYLQSHRSAPTLLTRHPYGQRQGDNPGTPWGWMTGPADVELAPDAIITDGTERKDGADINAVYVSGTTQGVLAQVKRSGTAGDKLAVMVTEPLITHVDAARQRGLSVLGAAGSKYNVRLDLPVLTGAGQPGVLDVGQLVQVNAAQPWRGRVRSVSVNAKRPSLRQTVTLERHMEIA